MTRKEKQQEQATFALHKAAARWAETYGGSVIVYGPISVQKWPDDRKLSYTIAIKCTGKLPAASKP